MADDETTGVPDDGQLLHADLKNHVKSRVRTALESIGNGADEFEGLAETLEHLRDLRTNAGPDELRRAAVGVRAVSTQAFSIACTMAGVSERLSAWAEVSGIVFAATDSDDA